MDSKQEEAIHVAENETDAAMDHDEPRPGDTSSVTRTFRWPRWMLRCWPSHKGQDSTHFRIPPRSEKETSLSSLLNRGLSMEKMTNYLYRSSFGGALLWFCFIYFILIVFYALVVHWVLSSSYDKDKECLNGWEIGAPLRENLEITMDLSWTTLSTVGYGTISPPAEANGCALLRWILSFEAFFGVLFAGFCGAIFYSKVTRLNTRAPVTFSSAVCVQFGTRGITEEPLLVSSKGDTESFKLRSPSSSTEVEKQTSFESEGEESSISPYPIMEFRAVNDKLKLPGNELLQASMKCVALSLLPPSDVRKSLREEHVCQSQFTSVELVKNNDDIYGEPLKRIYQDMTLLPDSHPFFDTVCYFRHVLDEKSPLLKPSVRQRLAELGGWPMDLNNCQAIRECFSSSVFEFVVSIEGTSNLTAEGVFKLHRYTFEDVYIGWRFVGLMPLDNALKHKNNLKQQRARRLFDLKRTHDIVPQRGGGNEPIGDRAADNNMYRFFVVDGLDE